MIFVKYFCTNCGQKCKSEEKYTGGKVNCPGCGALLEIPRYEIIPAYPIEVTETTPQNPQPAVEPNLKLLMNKVEKTPDLLQSKISENPVTPDMDPVAEIAQHVTIIKDAPSPPFIKIVDDAPSPPFIKIVDDAPSPPFIKIVGDAPHTTQKQSIPCPYCGVATKDKQVICTACGGSLEGFKGFVGMQGGSAEEDDDEDDNPKIMDIISLS